MFRKFAGADYRPQLMIDAFANAGYNADPDMLNFRKLATLENCVVGDQHEAGQLAKQLALLPGEILKLIEVQRKEAVRLH